MFLNALRISLLLGFIVVVLGAYTRLSDAGLGCPDWPGCYGRLLVPGSTEHIDQSNDVYAARPLEQHKAWKEMIHRYAAGLLGLLILATTAVAWKNRDRESQQLVVPTLLLGLVVFQALLGMWTVTLLLKPVVVMGHLLGGMTILALLLWTCMKETYRPLPRAAGTRPCYAWSIAGLVIVYLQISLGGWTSANYAALICPDFPACQGQWWPAMDFLEGFTPWRGLGINYEYGVLDGQARTAIHMSHRIGAVITLLAISAVAIQAIRTADSRVRRSGILVLVALFCQIGLGIGNILLTLPLPVAVAHNGVAAVLLLSLVTLMFHSKYRAGEPGP